MVTKEFLINLLIPLTSIFPLIALIREKQRHTLTIGISILIRTFSIKDININIEALPKAADEMFPLIMCITVSTGANAFIAVHKVFMYEIAALSIELTILNMVIEIQREEQRE